MITVAFRHGRFADITVNSVDLSTFCDSESLNIDVDSAETSTFQQNWKTFLAGMAGANLTLSGKYDPTVTTGPVSVFTGLIGDDAFPVVVDPGGSVTGQIRHSFNAILTNYSESAAIGDAITFSASLLVSGAVTTTNVA